MKANELRIGNCVIHEGKTKRISAIDASDKPFVDKEKTIQYNWVRFFDGTYSKYDPDDWDNLEDSQPVPLTKDIVRDWFGFKKAKRCEEGLTRYGIDLVFIDNGEIYVNRTGTRIKYVHQLQNFIHAVSGTEPTIKKP